jgi:hypothetical protein
VARTHTGVHWKLQRDGARHGGSRGGLR